MGHDPLAQLSVVMPVHDAAAYLAEAMESVLSQTFDDFEFLIFDDGSVDDSYAILDQYAYADTRITLVRGRHRGVARCLRELVELASSPLIARMDADDVAHPRRFEYQLEYLAAHPECVAVGCEVWLVDPERRPICKAGVAIDHESIEAQLLQGRGTALVHPSVAMRRDAVVEVGSYDVQAVSEDVDLFLRLAERGRLANLPRPLLEYRQHSRSVNAERPRELDDGVQAALRAAHVRRGVCMEETAYAPRRTRRQTSVERWSEWAHMAIGGGQIATARHYAWRVLAAAPVNPRSWALWLRAFLGLRIESLPEPLRGPARAVRARLEH